MGVDPSRRNHAGNPARHTALGTLQDLLASGLTLPLALVTAGFLTRKLGPEAFGVLSVAVSIVVLVEVSITVGFSRTAVKFVAESDDWKSKATGLLHAQLFVSLVGAALLALLAPQLSALLSSPELAPHLRLLALDIPVFALGNVHRSILIGRGHFDKRALLTGAHSFSRFGLIFLFVGLGLSITGAILAHIGASIVLFAIARSAIHPPLLKRSPLMVVKLWNYALPIFLFAVGMQLFQRVDLWLVKALSPDPQTAGHYGAAQNLTVVIGMFSASFLPLLLATLTRMLRTAQLQKARRMSGQILRLMLCLLPLAGIVAGSAGEIVKFVFGADFLPAAPVLALLFFAAFGRLLLGLVATILTAAGRPGLLAGLVAPFVLLALLSHLYFIPRFGPGAAAMGTTILSWAAAGVSMAVVARVWQVRIPVGTLARCVLVTGLVFWLSVNWPAPGWLLLAKLAAISACSLVTLRLLGEFSNAELTQFLSLFRSQPEAEKPRAINHDAS